MKKIGMQNILKDLKVYLAEERLYEMLIPSKPVLPEHLWLD